MLYVIYAVLDATSKAALWPERPFSCLHLSGQSAECLLASCLDPLISRVRGPFEVATSYLASFGPGG